MDVVRLLAKAPSDADIRKIPGGDAKITQYAELGNLYDVDQLTPDEKDTALYFVRTNPLEGIGQPHPNTKVCTNTWTPTVSNRMVGSTKWCKQEQASEPRRPLPD